MKQILQNLSNGEISIEDIPCPKVVDGSITVSTKKTLISAGTERMLLNFGKANYIIKAKQQPDKVKQVLDKILSDGFVPTFEAVHSKLNQPLPLGYCNVGEVIDSSVEGYKTGDRVVSNGSHAEVVRVSKNLCAKIPENVDDESASFTVIAAVGLQGVRLIKPTIGECFVVIGLGLIGLLCVQILRANGCRVLGVDFDTKKCDLAKKFGADAVDLSKNENLLTIAKRFSRSNGVDGVLITASSKSNDIIHQSAEICRKRGRIVLIGVTGLNLRREDFYKKEITFQVSSSYGPGRYDKDYEEKGNDYPIGFVRWTQQRNFEAILDMMSSGLLNVKALISNTFNFDDAIKAYDLLLKTDVLGIILNYPNQDKKTLIKSEVELNQDTSEYKNPATPNIGFIGAGNYASRVLIPAFRNTGVSLDTIVTSSGVSAVYHGNKNHFLKASSDVYDVFDSDDINTIVIVTRHNSHAKYVVDGLKSGKNIFVEKPLALSIKEIEEVNKAYHFAKNRNNIQLMVGFNRRFSPHIIKMKELLDIKHSPKSIIVTINAGEIPSEHWVQDLKIGGGRIIGECCHFIDLMRHLVGFKITNFHAVMIGDTPSLKVREDKVSITLSFDDGSFGVIHYLANGGNRFPKERVEVFCNDGVLQLDNYRTLKGYGWDGFKKMKTIKQDKGQELCVREFIDSIRKGKDCPIPFIEIEETSKVSIEIANSLK